MKYAAGIAPIILPISSRETIHEPSSAVITIGVSSAKSFGIAGELHPTATPTPNTSIDA